MAADKLTVARRSSVLLLALAKFADKTANRDHLTDGSATPIAVQIDGSVGRAAVCIDVRGTLNVGHPSTVSSSSAAPPCDVLASVLAEIPESTRVKLLDRLKRDYAKNDGVLVVDEALRNEAKAWLAALKMSKPSVRAGSVSFQV